MQRARQTRTARPSLEALESRWVPANVGSPNQNFIDQLYRDVLHRAPDSGSAGWVVSLDNGTDRGEVVDRILHSDEGLRNQVNDLYLRFLGRPAEAGALTLWANFLRDSDHTNLDLATRLIASDEYYQKAGGTNIGFLNALYRDVLGRPVTDSDIDDLFDDFGDDFRGTMSDRMNIAESVLQSDEGRDFRNQLSVRSFLRVSVDADAANDIVSDNDNGGGDFENDDAVFTGTLLSGDQYYRLAQTTATTNFATVPSSGNLAFQSVQVS